MNICNKEITILIVNDNSYILTAENGSESGGKFDNTDYQMSATNGLKFIQQLKQLEKFKDI